MQTKTLAILVLTLFSLNILAVETKRERKKESQQKKQHTEARKKHREEMEDDPFIDNYGNGETTNRKFNEESKSP